MKTTKLVLPVVFAVVLAVVFGIRAVSAQQSNPLQPSLNPDGSPGCVIPKAAGALKATGITSFQGAQSTWATFEDTKGTIRVYQYWEPFKNGFGQGPTPSCSYSHKFDRK